MLSVRIDKWLWAARFFKTRPLAVRACDLGRVEANGQKAKPARDVRVGDQLQITNEGGTYAVEVLALAEARGSAVVAQGLYRESEASRELRAKAAQERKEMLEFGGVAESRPSKRDRSQLNRLRGR